MRFAVFFHASTGYVAGSFPLRFDGPKLPIEACGSDSVLPFDGRYGMDRCCQEAREVCRKRGFLGFAIEVGPRYSDARRIRPYEAV